MKSSRAPWSRRRITPFTRPIAALMLAVLGVTVLASAGSAAGNRRRTVVKTYNGFGGVSAAAYPNVFLQDQFGDETVGGILLGARSRERYVSVAATDATSVPVGIRILFKKPGASEFSEKLLCARTPRPIAIDPGSAFHVFTVVGVCDGDTPSVPTRGKIEVTFTS